MPNPKISGVDAELILNAVREQCEAHKAGIKALQIHIDASANVTGVQLDEIQKHLKRLNGSVTDLYKKHEEVCQRSSNHKLRAIYINELKLAGVLANSLCH